MIDVDEGQCDQEPREHDPRERRQIDITEAEWRQVRLAQSSPDITDCTGARNRSSLDPPLRFRFVAAAVGIGTTR